MFATVDEHRDIYTQPGKTGGDENLPAYESTPNQIRAAVRRKTVLFSLLLMAFGVFAAVFAWNEHKRLTSKSDLRDMLGKPPPPAATAPRVRTLAPVEEPKTTDIFANKQAVATLSPQKMADAMAEIRAANQYVSARDWDNAETHVTNALAICPDMAMALRLRGLIYSQRGQFDEAVTVLERALRLDPFNAEAFNTLATVHIQKKQFDRAEELLQTALSIRPGFAATEVNLGLLYVLEKKYDLAIEQLQDAAPQLSDNAAVLNNIGVCYLRMDRQEDARQKFQEVIKNDPKRAAPYFNIAMSYSIQKDVTNAISWIRQGAAQCTPADVQRFLTDSDFDSIRGKPEYQTLVRDLYPQLPRGPGG